MTSIKKLALVPKLLLIADGGETKSLYDKIQKTAGPTKKLAFSCILLLEKLHLVKRAAVYTGDTLNHLVDLPLCLILTVKQLLKHRVKHYLKRVIKKHQIVTAYQYIYSINVSLAYQPLLFDILVKCWKEISSEKIHKTCVML